MQLILRQRRAFYQRAWVLTLTYLRLTVPIERLQFAMVEELMESQTLVVLHLYQCAMASQEPMDTQELIAWHLLCQPVD